MADNGMDNIFVQRPDPARRSRPGSRAGSDDGVSAIGRDGARQILEEMAREIVLDEAPDANTLTPDERRLRDASNPEDRQAVGGMVDSLFARRKEPTESPEMAPADGEVLADSLFVRPARPAEDGEAANLGIQNRKPPSNAVNDLFVSKNPEAHPEAQPSLPSGINWSRPDEEDDGDDLPDEGNESGQAKVAARQMRWKSPSLDWEAMRLRCPRPPDARTLLRFGLPAVIAMLLLGVATAALATGCEEDAPLGRFCVAEGDDTVSQVAQWTVAFAPATLIMLCGGAWLKRRYDQEEAGKAAAWRNDSDAQRSASEVLDALMTAPATEQAKYARQVVQILKDFPDTATLQHKGCMALEVICRAGKGNASQVYNAGAVTPILEALETHRRIRQLQRSALSTLACIAKVGRTQIFELGGIPNILASLAKFRRDPEIQVSGALALGALCLSASRCRLSVAKYGGVGLFFAALERHAERAEVVVAVAETLALLASSGDAELLASIVTGLPAVQSLQNRWHEFAEAAVDGQRGPKENDCKVVMKSLEKLESHLSDSSGNYRKRIRDEDDWSEAGTPRENAQKNSLKAAQEEVLQAQELVDRYKKWNTKRNTR